MIFSPATISQIGIFNIKIKMIKQANKQTKRFLFALLFRQRNLPSGIPSRFGMAWTIAMTKEWNFGNDLEK